MALVVASSKVDIIGDAGLGYSAAGVLNRPTTTPHMPESV